MKQLTILVVLLATSASIALAVGTSYWTHTTEADFKAGTFDNVVATNLGDLKLSRAMRTIVQQDSRISAVYALAEAKDGSIYAATGPQGALLKINGEKFETAAELGDNVNLFSLLIDHQDRVLIGTGGERGQVLRIDKPGDKPTPIFSSDDVQYVWSLVKSKDGNVYAGTGPNGQLIEIHPDGSNKVLFDSDENNLMSMVLSDDGEQIYVGSDPNGHVYRVNRKTGESFVVFDAPETEISALALDARGNIYAGTGQSTGIDTGIEAPGATERVGRLETEGKKESPSIPIPGDQPKQPKPPELPLPSPGEPQPIPSPKEKSSAPAKGPEPKKMMIVPEQAGPDDPGPAPEPTPAPGRRPKRPPVAVAARQAQQNMNQMPPVAPQKGGEPAAEGNAVYRIDAQGFVSEIFRGSVVVLSIVEREGLLLVGTGADGMVYQINPSAGETSVIAKIDPNEVLCLLPTRGGDIMMGTANEGRISSMSSGFASRGTFTSPVLDAQQISRFGKLQLRGTLPSKTKLTVSTRSGNVAETQDAGWSKWSDESGAARFVSIGSPSARFFQYRLTFTSSDDNKETPIVTAVTAAYQSPNQAPEVKTIKITSKDAGGGLGNGGNGPAQAAAAGNENAARGTGAVTIEWEASDPNSDTLGYTLYYRRDGNGPWTLLKEKLAETSYEWNTRSIGDGRYEIKVVASDALANPMGEGRSASRVSDSFEVDNAPPAIGDLKVSPKDNDSVSIVAVVVDRTSTVALLEYALDGSSDWQSVLPSDKIADSPEEAYDLTLGGLSPGPHQVALRATDAHGNQAFESVTVTIGK